MKNKFWKTVLVLIYTMFIGALSISVMGQNKMENIDISLRSGIQSISMNWTIEENKDLYEGLLVQHVKFDPSFRSKAAYNDTQYVDLLQTPEEGSHKFVVSEGGFYVVRITAVTADGTLEYLQPKMIQVE